VLVALGAVVSMTAGLMTADPARAGRGPKWQMGVAEPFTLPADYCGFPIEFSWPMLKEYSKVLKAADGSMIVLTTGVDKIVATNVTTGKTLPPQNISGPAKVTTFPDGSVTFSSKGISGFILSPADAERFGMPTVGATAGAQTETIDADGDVTSFSLQGHVVVDTCAALS
jgi:hypothetical protein